ncbi:MAG: hypothetical protein HON65_11850 [Rhodospirillales bacterium]|nr:hypothetical protein [Rhodospirillales bacterium]
MNLSAYHPTRRAMIQNVLVASGFAPALLMALGRASGNSELPILPGIQEMSGAVFINAQPAIIGQEVHSGDIVTTGPDGDCVIIIGEHVYLIHEDSEVEFYPEYIEEALNASPSGLITITAGAMLSVFGKTNTTITTPVATIGIRGTACYVDTSAEKTYVCVCYGTGDLGGKQDGLHLETVKTKHHDSPRYIYPAGHAKRIETAPVIDHTDKELRMLEALVNRRPPFYKKKKISKNDY